MPEAENLASALVAFQAEAPRLHRDATNSHFRNRYASLDEIVATISPILSKHGLAWCALPEADEHGNPALTYRLYYGPTGETLEGQMPLLLSKQDAQGQGSAITYARRYALCAVLNLVADDDDDGNAAARRGRSEAPSDFAPQTQVKLTDDKAKRLITEAEKLHADIVAINPSHIPESKFRGWLRSSWHDHDALGRLNEYLGQQWAELQETAP